MEEHLNDLSFRLLGDLWSTMVHLYIKSILQFNRFLFRIYLEPIDLISDTGIIAGLLLGASLLTLIHVIVHTIVALLDCFLANRVSY